MQTPVGPSLQVMLALSSSMARLAETAVTEVWERWVGPQRFARKLAQLERDGFVERTAAHDSLERVVRLTEAGRAAAAGGRDPDKCWARRWDGRWRMAIFDVAEARRTERARLQRHLWRLHFGYLQDSVWISPDPVESLREAVGGLGVDAAMLMLMEAQPCGGETPQDVVLGAWNFGRINRAYEDYLKILRMYSANGSDRARRSWMHVEWRAWKRAVTADPMLPRELLPSGYRGIEAWELKCERLGQIAGGS